jgi:transposase
MSKRNKRVKLKLDKKSFERLRSISKSRTESAAHVERAKILLSYWEGFSIAAIAREMKTNRPKIERCIDKALEIGSIGALDDLKRSGRPRRIDVEARSWLISLACQKPKELGYSYELWTTDLLSKHVKKNCRKAKHPSLAKLSRGTVSKILSEHEIKPHKIKYYLEKRDPNFDEKMTQVLCVYKEVNILRAKGLGADDFTAYLSYDEKPGIQAIENTVADLPPVQGKHTCVGRDYEYKRHGTLSLMAGIDLLTGEVIGQIKERHRSKEFVEYLKLLDKHYSDKEKIRIILDNHSAHISKETQTYLKTVANRFEFIFTPKHGSWLNLIEMFFSKMARTFLRGIRVSSKQELKNRIKKYLKEINQAPVVFKWKYKMDSIQVA